MHSVQWTDSAVTHTQALLLFIDSYAIEVVEQGHVSSLCWTSDAFRALLEVELFGTCASNEGRM